MPQLPWFRRETARHANKHIWEFDLPIPAIGMRRISRADDCKAVAY